MYLATEPTAVSWPAAERDALLSQAFETLGQVAQSPFELNTVAIYHIIQRAPERAVPFAQRAARADPDCWSCLHTYAAATFQVGQAAEAAELERSALERLPDDAPSKTTAVLTHDRDRYLRAAAPRAHGEDDQEPAFLFWPD